VGAAPDEAWVGGCPLCPLGIAPVGAGEKPTRTKVDIGRHQRKVGSTRETTRASSEVTKPMKRGHRSPDPPCEQGELTSTVAPAEHYALLQALVGPLLGHLGTRRGLAFQARLRTLP